MRFRTSALVSLFVALGVCLGPAVGTAQTRFTYSKGQSVSPAYEGWWQNEDGTYTMFFGYMNSNWLEELDVPIGPDNQHPPREDQTGDSRRTSTPAGTCSCSPSSCPPTSASRKSCGR